MGVDATQDAEGGGQPAAHSQVVFYFFNGGRWPGLPGYLGRRGLAGFAQREMGRRANPVGISVPYLTQVSLSTALKFTMRCEHRTAGAPGTPSTAVRSAARLH